MKEHLLQVCPDNLDKMPEEYLIIISCCSYLLKQLAGPVRQGIHWCQEKRSEGKAVLPAGD